MFFWIGNRRKPEPVKIIFFTLLSGRSRIFFNNALKISGWRLFITSESVDFATLLCRGDKGVCGWQAECFQFHAKNPYRKFEQTARSEIVSMRWNWGIVLSFKAFSTLLHTFSSPLSETNCVKLAKALPPVRISCMARFFALTIGFIWIISWFGEPDRHFSEDILNCVTKAMRRWKSTAFPFTIQDLFNREKNVNPACNCRNKKSDGICCIYCTFPSATVENAVKTNVLNQRKFSMRGMRTDSSVKVRYRPCQ